MAEGSGELQSLEEEMKEHEQKMIELKEKIEKLKGDSPVPKRRKLTLNPSSVTWDKLVNENIVHEFWDFRRAVKDCHKNISLTESCGQDAFKNIIKSIDSNLEKSNEGYPTVFCSVELVHIVEHLGENYSLEIFPVIHEVKENHSKDKKSDYFVLQIRNRRIVVVTELKFGLSIDYITHKKDLAQLFLETYYTVESDKELVKRYNTTISILGDHNVWHLFVMDVSRQPYEVLEYYTLKDCTLDKKCFFVQQKVKELK